MKTQVIKKLVDQVGTDTSGKWIQVDKLTEFAESIIEECSKVIVNGGYRNPALGEKHPLTPPEIAIMIKEHFKIKE